MKISEVCKECSERYPGCHDHCDKYREAKQDFDNQKDIIYKAKHNETVYRSYLRYRNKRGGQV